MILSQKHHILSVMDKPQRGQILDHGWIQCGLETGVKILEPHLYRELGQPHPEFECPSFLVLYLLDKGWSRTSRVSRSSFAAISR